MRPPGKTLAQRKRRQREREAERIVCAICGQPSGMRSYGTWCQSCYTLEIHGPRRQRRAAQGDREERIKRYEERAALGLPLFD